MLRPYHYNRNVDNEIIERLLSVNRQFYQTFAVQFSQTRQRLQPGVRRILDTYLAGPGRANRIMDLGCGNGELARELARRDHEGPYLGLDFSRELLEEARKNMPPEYPAAFYRVDFSQAGWEARLPEQALHETAPFDDVLAFAVLHHLPGAGLRRSLLDFTRRHTAPGGRFIHSEWQFLNSPRLRARLQPWETIGLRAEDVEPGDYLMDWRQGGYGLRYVHHFSIEELDELAGQTGFTITDSFLSDGEGGKLGLYQVWEHSRHRLRVE